MTSDIQMRARQGSGPAIHVKGLEKSYNDLKVLGGVEFDVAPGSIFALLGSNGAGKTTVIKILSTLLKADAGTATVHGFDVATQAGDVRGAISLTGQFAAVDEILTGRENLVLVVRLRHLKNPTTIADGLLERFSLADAAIMPFVRQFAGVHPSWFAQQAHWQALQAWLAHITASALFCSVMQKQPPWRPVAAHQKNLILL